MENSSSVQLRTSALLKNLGTLTLLIVALPLNLAIVVAAVIWNAVVRVARQRQTMFSDTIIGKLQDSGEHSSDLEGHVVVSS